MNVKQLHKLGATLMWGGTSLSFLFTILVVSGKHFFGILGFLVSVIIVIAGIYMKKKYCPSCYGRSCKIKNNEKAAESQKKDQHDHAHHIHHNNINY